MKLNHCASRLMMGLAIAAGCALLPYQTAGALAQQVKPDYPKLSFPKEMRGVEAITALGGNLAAVAAWHGMTPEELRQSFLHKTDLRLTDRVYILGKDGRIRIAEWLTTYPNAQPAYTQLFPLGSTFQLHSNRGAKRTIYLNFKSDHSVIPTDFKLYVQNVWQRVAEDFAPFDVDVTTEFVPGNMTYRSGADGPAYGFTVNIESQNGTWGTPYIADVALGSFDDREDARRVFTVKTPVTVTSTDLTADAISHFLGHAMGLRDDDADPYFQDPYTADPYLGHNTPTGWWASIMGYPFLGDITQFSRGEFDGAISKPDSIAKIQQIIPLRADDAGETTLTAAKLPLTPGTGVSTGSIDGIIGRQGDKDVYAITAGAGTFQATVTPSPLGANADLVLTLLNANGLMLATNNPPESLSAKIVYPVPRSGTYFLQVSSTGVGDPRKNGYSDYGSIGTYKLGAVAAPYAGLPPVATLTATPASGPAPLSVRLDASASRDDGQVKFVYWDFGDGTKDNSGTLRTLNKTYSLPGIYPVSIRVVDNDGMSSTATQTLTVTASAQKNVVTAKIDLSLVAMSSTSSAAYGTLYVTDGSGNRLPNATVTYKWSGLQQGQRSVTSQTQGSPIISLASSQKGCFVLTVTAISLAGYTYNAGAPVSSQVCR